LAFLQQSSNCRKVFKLFSRSPKDLEFSISTSLNNNPSSLFNTSISVEELIKLNLQESEGKILKWTLIANSGSEVVANLSVIFKPKNCFFPGYWLSEVKIKPQYWGSRIEEKIFQRAGELLGALGTHLIFTSFLKKDYLSRMLFQRLGFQGSPAYKNSSETRIILERKIAA
jgi:hypothetical protein